MSLEDVVGIVGVEFLFEYLSSFRIFDGDDAFVLAPLIWRSETYYHRAVHFHRQLFADEQIEESFRIDASVLFVFRLLAKEDVAGMQVLHKLHQEGLERR